MAKDGDDSLNHNSLLYKDSQTNKSFVKKVKSRVSGFLPSTLTKWFGNNDGQRSVVRQREEVEDEDDESFQIQPPSKRPRSERPSQDKYDLNLISTPIHGSQQQHILNSYTNNLNNVHTVFQEPMPGPSGVKSRKLLIQNSFHNGALDLINGDKDSDSGESTSGYSSMPRIGSKEQVSEITDKHSTPSNKPINNRSIFNSTMAQERSLFNDRTGTGSPQINSSLSSRRPSFNASIGSPNFIDRTLSTKRIVNSPFYGGRTTYGGASAYSRHLIKKSPEKLSSLRNFVQAKPVNEQSNNVTLSKTAKRILDTLEQYTSPTADVKRIPNPKRQKVEGLLSKYTSVNPYIIRETKVPSNRELNVPTMTDLLKMKLKERLQDSTVSVRSMATNSNSPLNVEEYKIRKQEDEPAAARNTNKMKTKVAAVRQRLEVDETVEEVKLPEIKLPISTLPSFDFTIPSPFAPKIKESPKILVNKTIKKPIEIQTSVIIKPTEIKDYNKHKNTDYKFSNPLIIAENMKTIKAINNFKFSEPLNKKIGGVEAAQKTDNNKNNFKSFDINSASLKKIAPKINEINGTSVSPAKDLMKTGSVMDILGKKENLMDKFKPALNTWECQMCMIRNEATELKCIACETPKIKKINTTPIGGFGNQFKMATNQWECQMCLIRNDADKSVCVACETPKVGAKKPEATFVNSSSFGSNSGFGNAFKMASDKWECEACMVRNEANVTSCVACTTPKATNGPKATYGFGDKFNKSASTWECAQCMVRNPNDKLKCLACEASKPGTQLIPAIPTIAKSTFGETFKKKESEWECGSCMVRNPADKLKCLCCESQKPGSINNCIELKPAPVESVPKFSFGIDKAEVNATGFSFGIKPGMNANNADKVNASAIFGATATKIDTTTTTGFSFGMNGTKTEVANKPIEIIKPIVPQIKETPVITAAFSFGSTNSLKRGVEDTDVTPIKKAMENNFGTPNNKIALNGDVKENGIVEKSKPIQFGSSIVFGASNATPNPTTPGSNLFSFGAKPAAIKSPEDTLATPNFKFNADTKVAPTFGTPKTASTVFGPNIATPTPSFGTPAPSFGTPAPAGPLFSFGASKPVAPNPTSMFGAAQPPSSMFGAVTSHTAPRPAVAASSTNSGFAFSAPSAASDGGFSFSAPKNDASTFQAPASTVASNLFGGAPAQPVQNGTFSFGSNAPSTPKAGFAFAGTTAPPSFNFASNSAAAMNTQSGGFNFGASAPTPNFNAEINPTFSFNAGSAPNMFSAQPSGEQQSAQKSRVIRRAHRRTQR